MKIRMPMARAVTVCLLLLLVLAAITAGCSSGPSGQATTAASEASTGTSTTTSQGVTTTTSPIELTADDKELAKTAKVANQLVAFLSDQQVGQDDPRMGIIFGLRARIQALTCSKALDQGDMELADTAMKDVYSTVNLGRNVATGTVAQTLTDAQAIVATLGRPSDNAGQAATLLDQFIARLAPLLDEATAITPATTST
ncbi:MAG: hypothetical protein V1912_03110 [bacterium]